jgi:hypothetical protein
MNEEEPLIQGDLDEWSAIYSVLNSIRWLHPETDLEIFSSMFAESLARTTELRKGRQSARVTYGLSCEELENLLNILLPEYQMGYRSLVDDTSVSEWNLFTYWRAISNFLERAEGKGVVLTQIKGLSNHWTVVTSISNDAMILYDSQYCDVLERVECTVSDQSSSRHYHLSPIDTFLVYRRD